MARAASVSAPMSAQTSNPKPGQRERCEGDGAAEPPAARVFVGDVARGRADHEDGRRCGTGLGGSIGVHRVSCSPTRHRHRSSRLYFYELHEGDEEIFTDLLLVHEEQFEPEDFFELVQAVRSQVQDSFEEDTLIEAIALELNASIDSPSSPTAA